MSRERGGQGSSVAPLPFLTSENRWMNVSQGRNSTQKVEEILQIYKTTEREEISRR